MIDQFVNLKSKRWFDINNPLPASSLRTNNVSSHMTSKMHDYDKNAYKQLGGLLLSSKSTNAKHTDDEPLLTSPRLSKFRSSKEIALKILKNNKFKINSKTIYPTFFGKKHFLFFCSQFNCTSSGYPW